MAFWHTITFTVPTPLPFPGLYAILKVMENHINRIQFPASKQERRRFPRYGCSFRVYYTTKGVAVIESVAAAKNISKGGLGLPVSRLVKKGDSLKLRILNEDSRREISANATVRWTRNGSAKNPLLVDAGLQFTNIKPSEVDDLLATVT